MEPGAAVDGTGGRAPAGGFTRGVRRPVLPGYIDGL